MMTSCDDVLDALQNELGGVSDYQVSRALNVPPNEIYSIRKNRRKLSKSQCVRAAEILDIEPAIVLTIVAADRENDAQIRASLLRLAEQGMAAMLLIGLGIMAGLPAAQAVQTVTFCILCQITKGLGPALFDPLRARLNRGRAPPDS